MVRLEEYKDDDTPVTLRAKLMLQGLWKEGMGCDEELSVEKVDIWKKIEADLLELTDMKVQRFIGNENCQLLCFCDASAKVYATCIYLRCIKEGEVTTNLFPQNQG